MTKGKAPLAFIFDVGDTLVGFGVHSWERIDRQSAEALAEASRQEPGLALHPATFLQVFRRVVDEEQRRAVQYLEEVPARRCLERALAELGYRDLPAPTLDRLERAWSAPRLAVRQVFEDVHQVLDRLAGWGIRLGIVSNIWLSGPIVREHLQGMGLARYFHSVVLSSELGKIKPHPEPFRQSLAELGVQPQQAWFVGDNPHADVAGAASVGMHPVLIRRPPYPGQVPASQYPYEGPSPELVIDSLHPLTELARRLMAGLGPPQPGQRPEPPHHDRRWAERGP